MKGFVSIVCRGLINTESLSGVETIGNLSRHRTAPVVIPNGNGYTIRFVPVLSGESLAHYYQELLVEQAEKLGLPLSERSRRFEFLKFSAEELLTEEKIQPAKDENEIRRVEVDILLKDYVCDVGGFLCPAGVPVKRTSCFQVGYAIPAIYEGEASALESQFHMRFAPSKMKEYQQPYNVEVASALYTFTFTLNLNKIGVPSTNFGVKDEKKERELAIQREKRVKGALTALLNFFSSLAFGAKRSRFLPNIEIVSTVATYSKDHYFIASAGNSKNYINATLERKSKFLESLSRLGFKVSDSDIDVYIFDKEGATKELKTYSSVEEVLSKVIERATQA
jgi:CRISPR-associated protein Csa2